MWNKCLTDALLSLGFLGSKTDSSLFFKCAGERKLFCLIYVDDILVMGSDSALVQSLVTQLQNKFAVRDLGKLSYFLGIETSAGLHLQQGKYVGDLLKRVHMDSCSNISTPASPSTKLSSTEGSQFNNSTLYRSVVGALQYLTFTRPDIAFAVTKVSQFMHCTMDSHWTAVKHILRYIKATPSHGLFFAKGTSTLLHGYTDSDWGGDVNDRKSTTRFAIFLGSNLISWASRK
ncbi:putative mitochondrial protein, partial [Nicotiana attenuata]